MKKETTLDTLAILVANGFSAMGKRFDRLEGRVDTLGKEVRATNGRIDQTNARLDTIVMPVLDDHSHRIKDLELAK